MNYLMCLLCFTSNWHFLLTDMDYTCIIILFQAWRLHTKKQTMDMLDPALRSTEDAKQVAMCVHLGLLCTQADPKLRPDMRRVVVILSKKPGPLEEPVKPGVSYSKYKKGSHGLRYSGYTTGESSAMHSGASSSASNTAFASNLNNTATTSSSSATALTRTATATNTTTSRSSIQHTIQCQCLTSTYFVRFSPSFLSFVFWFVFFYVGFKFFYYPFALSFQLQLNRFQYSFLPSIINLYFILSIPTLFCPEQFQILCLKSEKYQENMIYHVFIISVSGL